MKRILRPLFDGRLLCKLAILEVGVLLAIVCGYRANYKPDLSSFFLSLPGWGFLAAMIMSLLAAGSIVRALFSKGGNLALRTIGVNAALLVTIVGPAEALPRYLATKDLAGEHIGSLLLRPRPWEQVVQRYNAMLQDFDAHPRYFVGDPLLGWTVGKNRRSADGYMESSDEGIRVESGAQDRPNSSTSCTVAIVGDSFALAEGISYGETWGASLERDLPPFCRVLNFAVSGHSVGQMYLRFKRDVLPRRPDVVLMAFTDGALSRTMGVYGFLIMTDGEWPWAHPRFVVRDHELLAINLPLPEPKEIYSAESIRDLPFITYDRWFLPTEWEQRFWNLAYASYAFRWITSLYPLFEADRAEVSDDAVLAVNKALLVSFQALAEADGVRPVVLYLPKRDDYAPHVSPLTRSLMEQVGGEFVDATPCVGALTPGERFLSTNYHYTAAGNRAVAACVMPKVRAALAQRPTKMKDMATHG